MVANCSSRFAPLPTLPGLMRYLASFASLAGELNLRRVERFLTVAWESGAAPVVVLTKLDLCDDPSELIFGVKAVALGAEVVAVSAVTGEGFDALERHLLP